MLDSGWNASSFDGGYAGLFLCGLTELHVQTTLIEVGRAWASNMDVSETRTFPADVYIMSGLRLSLH